MPNDFVDQVELHRLYWDVSCFISNEFKFSIGRFWIECWILALPFACFQIQIDDLRAVNLFLWMIWTVCITSATKNVHSIIQNRSRMKVSIAGRLSRSPHVCPVHCLQVQFVYIARELVDFLFETAKYVHKMVDDASTVSITDTRNVTSHLWLWPSQRVSVKAEQDVATRLIVSPAPPFNA